MQGKTSGYYIGDDVVFLCVRLGFDDINNAETEGEEDDDDDDERMRRIGTIDKH